MIVSPGYLATSIVFKVDAPGDGEFPRGIDLNIDFFNRVFVAKVAIGNVVELCAKLPLRAELQ